jgi:hypothetical protein
MSNDWQIGEWMVQLDPDGSDPQVCDLKRQPVATVHGSREESMKRAMLIAAAPSLREAAQASLSVFQAIATFGDENSKLAAQDMIPVLEVALYTTRES